MVGTDRSAYDSQQLGVLDDLLAASARGPDVGDLFQHLCAVGPSLVPYDEAQLVVSCGHLSERRYAYTDDGAFEQSDGTAVEATREGQRTAASRCRAGSRSSPAVRPEGSGQDRQSGRRRISVVFAPATRVFVVGPDSRRTARQLRFARSDAPAASRTRPAMRRSNDSGQPRSRPAPSCSGPSRTSLTFARCFRAYRRSQRRCCRTTRWRWCSSIATVISCARRPLCRFSRSAAGHDQCADAEGNHHR